MKYIYLHKFLYSEYTELFEKVFEQYQFSYPQDVIVDRLSNHTGEELDEAIDNARYSNCNIIDDDIVILPAGSTFNIERCPNRENLTDYMITKNGAYYKMKFDSSDNIGVVITAFGNKFMQYMEESDIDSIDEAYGKILQIQQIFGVKLIK